VIYKRIKGSQGLQPSLRNERQELRSVVGLKTSSTIDHARHLGLSNNLDPRIIEWIRSSELDHDKYTYTLVVPLGADESWEETVNGDAFERKDLAPENSEWGHKTFECNGRAYSHHKNDDPSVAYGDLPFMVYNHEADRCEGIWRLDNQRAEQFNAKSVIDRIRQGIDVPISMGCKVKYDVCSFCGNKAKSPAEYCDHPRNPGFGHIDPVTFKKMRVFNPHPSFFDLSDVNVNAAPEAVVLGWLFPALERYLKGVLKQSQALILPSVFLHEAQFGITGHNKISTSKGLERLDGLKFSDLIKQIPILNSQVLGPLMDSEDGLSEEEIKNVESSCLCPQASLTNLLAQGIVLRPSEFSRILDPDDPTETDIWPSELEQEIRRSFASPLQMDLIDSHWLSATGLQSAKDLCDKRSILSPFIQTRLARCIAQRPQIRARLEIEVPRSNKFTMSAKLYGTYLRQAMDRIADLVALALERFPISIEAQKRIGYKLSQGHQPNHLTNLQAVLGSGYLIRTSGCLTGPWLQHAVVKMNRPGSSHLFGSLLFKEDFQ
jgi:hypothetical protein